MPMGCVRKGHVLWDCVLRGRVLGDHVPTGHSTQQNQSLAENQLGEAWSCNVNAHAEINDCSDQHESGINFKKHNKMYLFTFVFFFVHYNYIIFIQSLPGIKTFNVPLPHA